MRTRRKRARAMTLACLSVAWWGCQPTALVQIDAARLDSGAVRDGDAVRDGGAVADLLRHDVRQADTLQPVDAGARDVSERDGAVPDTATDAAYPACPASGPTWADLQTVNVGSNAAPGRTGQWWCDNHFGANFGGSWECVDATGGHCLEDVPADGDVVCGRLGVDGTTPWCGAFAAAPRLGYGRLEQILVTQSASGQTGRWWCDNHFGTNLGGRWKCRSVSGGHGCDETTPANELVSCSQYEDVQVVNVGSNAGAGRTGQWWCDSHFGNSGGSWDCLGVAAGSCSADAPAGADVTCGRFTAVDESSFAPSGCSAADLDGAEREFCAYTEYMTTRTSATLYLYNDFLRAGVNRSFGGALFELYGADKHNRIEEHGGSACQFSIWGYDATGTGAGYFRTTTCDPSPWADGSACQAANGGAACRYFLASGAQICDCSAARPCLDWSAAGPYNPLQAQAIDCGWNGPTNDATVEPGAPGVTLVQSTVYQFTKTNALPGLSWSLNASVKSDRPYVRLVFHMLYTGPQAIGEHNQEIPALFTDDTVSYWYYFYGGTAPYADATGFVTRLRASFGSELALPGRSAPFPQPPAANPWVASEEWMTVCDQTEARCLTMVSFAPIMKTFVQDGSYVTPLGRFALGASFDQSWDLYLFPYRFDQVVAGKSVRQWIYDLKAGL